MEVREKKIFSSININKKNKKKKNKKKKKKKKEKKKYIYKIETKVKYGVNTGADCWQQNQFRAVIVFI